MEVEEAVVVTEVADVKAVAEATVVAAATEVADVKAAAAATVEAATEVVVVKVVTVEAVVVMEEVTATTIALQEVEAVVVPMGTGGIRFSVGFLDWSRLNLLMVSKFD